MTRGTYRIDVLNDYDSATKDIRLPLFGNETSSIAYGAPTLILPTREAAQQTLSGTP